MSLPPDRLALGWDLAALQAALAEARYRLALPEAGLTAPDRPRPLQRSSSISHGGSVNRSKQKGTSAESAVVAYLRDHGFPHAERRALAGVLDKGDVAGVIDNVIEVKNCTRDGLPGWVDETEAERVNAGARYGVCWHKRRGKGSPGAWFVTMTGEQYVAMLRALGYGTPAEGVAS